MSEAIASNIPEPIRTHLDCCDGLTSCVDKNLTYRTERALRCGADFLREAALAWLAHRNIEALGDPLESFVQHADEQMAGLVGSIRQSLADFEAHPPVHPYQCTKPELQQEIDRHYRLTGAMRSLQESVERGMEVYLPCKKGDWIMTEYGTGLVRGVEGTTVHAFVPEQWGSENAFVAESAIYMPIVVIPNTGSSYINFPSYYFMCDAWRWSKSASAQADVRHPNANALADHAEHSVKCAALAWISEHDLFMEKYSYTNSSGLLDALHEHDAPTEFVGIVHEFFEALHRYQEDLNTGKANATGLPEWNTMCGLAMDVCNIVSKACCVSEFIEPGHWVRFGEGKKCGQVVWRKYSYLKVATESGVVHRLGIYSGPVERIQAPEEVSFPDSACFRRLVWFESHPDVGDLDICQCCGGPFSDSDDMDICELCGWGNIRHASALSRLSALVARRGLLDALVGNDSPADLSQRLRTVQKVLRELDNSLKGSEDTVRYWLSEKENELENLYNEKTYGEITNALES